MSFSSCCISCNTLKKGKSHSFQWNIVTGACSYLDGVQHISWSMWRGWTHSYVLFIYYCVPGTLNNGGNQMCSKCSMYIYSVFLTALFKGAECVALKASEKRDTLSFFFSFKVLEEQSHRKMCYSYVCHSPKCNSFTIQT